MIIRSALKKGEVTLIGLAKLLGMKFKEYPEGYTTITYDQFETPNESRVACECRGVVFDENYDIVCRGFDRFFNYGEPAARYAGVDFRKAKIYEKLDGSLIKIWYDHKANQWRTSTSNRIYGESQVSDHGITFKELVYLALNVKSDEEFNLRCEPLEKDATHIYEVTSPYNRIVTVYSETTLWYLASRRNKTGEYLNIDGTVIGAKLPRVYELDTIEACLKAAEELGNREEGFVLYENNIPRLKIKSPDYVRIHHIRGEDLSVGRICNLIIKNEINEYLTYFPDDSHIIMPFKKGFDMFIGEVEQLYDQTKHIQDSKELALTLKGNNLLHFVFSLRNGSKNVKEAFLRVSEPNQKEILKKYAQKAA